MEWDSRNTQGSASSSADSRLKLWMRFSLYGTRRRHCGADIYYLDKKSRRRLVRAFGRERYSKLERALDSYVVVSDDRAILTAGHRLNRLKF